MDSSMELRSRSRCPPVQEHSDNSSTTPKEQLTRQNESEPAAPFHAGDIAKLIVLVLTIAFLALLVCDHSGWKAFLSHSYREDGFCIGNKSLDPFWQSHSLCFFANSLMALVMLLLAVEPCVKRKGSGTKLCEAAAAPMKKNAVSLFGHGCGHLFLALTSNRAFENLRTAAASQTTTAIMLQQIAAFTALFFVWFCFTRDSRFRTTRTAALFALFHNGLQFFVFPTQFFFTHVLLAVLGGSAIRNVWFRDVKTKDVFYDLEAILVDIPILLMTFGESLFCDSFFINYGGHLWFDMVVPVGFFIYYGVLVASGRGNCLV